MKQDLIVQGKIAAPGIAGAIIYGFTLAEWAALFTATYFAASTGYVIWKWRNEAKKGKSDKK